MNYFSPFFSDFSEFNKNYRKICIFVSDFSVFFLNLQNRHKMTLKMRCKFWLLFLLFQSSPCLFLFSNARQSSSSSNGVIDSVKVITSISDIISQLQNSAISTVSSELSSSSSSKSSTETNGRRQGLVTSDHHIHPHPPLPMGSGQSMVHSHGMPSEFIQSISGNSEKGSDTATTTGNVFTHFSKLPKSSLYSKLK